ncbi:hypothetical protein K402DRAFT_388805 [Aulographum hederae CBS 113979]|uniref:Uncharacterized protein n=1 Tax=Aulographum hederae CBS 113979 TaxID=1176131 RepID=A0A6G1HE04_9PEZI|nr:hypothetical protein K402DRAFT_388805 [Aulographum hederae CBS 113979]
MSDNNKNNYNNAYANQYFKTSTTSNPNPNSNANPHSNSNPIPYSNALPISHPNLKPKPEFHPNCACEFPPSYKTRPPLYPTPPPSYTPTPTRPRETRTITDEYGRFVRHTSESDDVLKKPDEVDGKKGWKFW